MMINIMHCCNFKLHCQPALLLPVSIVTAGQGWWAFSLECLGCRQMGWFVSLIVIIAMPPSIKSKVLSQNICFIS